MNQRLQGKIALVTGASRGIGKGIALELANWGATVYLTARSTHADQLVDGLGGSVYATADEIAQTGGRAIPLRCDHTQDTEVDGVFDRIQSEAGRLDVLVNNVWGGYQHMVESREDEWVYTWENPFWEQPRWRWDAMFAAGVRAHYVCSQRAARLMVARQSGLIVHISFWAAQKYLANVAYGVAKAASDKMAADMAHELRRHRVAAVSLYPGLVRTEAVLRAAASFDLSNSESPRFTGRAIASLALDPDLMEKSGRVLIAAQLAQEYGFTDVDGQRPRPLTPDTA